MKKFFKKNWFSLLFLAGVMVGNIWVADKLWKSDLPADVIFSSIIAISIFIIMGWWMIVMLFTSKVHGITSSFDKYDDEDLSDYEKWLLNMLDDNEDSGGDDFGD